MEGCPFWCVKGGLEGVEFTGDRGLRVWVGVDWVFFCA